MKKLICSALALAMALSVLAGCGSKNSTTDTTAPANPSESTTAPSEAVADPTAEGTDAPAASELEAFIESIYAKHAPLEMPLMTMTLDLNEVEVLTSYTGLTSAEKLKEVAASEAMMGQAYSLVVAKVANKDDAASVAKEMFEKVDQRKWICVEADTKVAAYCGDIVMFFMVSSEFSDIITTSSVVEAFKTACGADVTVID